MKRRSLFVVVLTILVIVTVLGPRASLSGQGQAFAQAQPTPGIPLLQKLLFLPFLSRARPPTFDLTGMITDGYARPLAGVTVVDQYGHSAVTDSSGHYTITGLAAGRYSLAPKASGYNFAPAAQQVNLTGPAQPLNFTGLTACSEAITNGGFEAGNGWSFPSGDAIPAGYTTTQFHSGAQSMRTGIPTGGTNKYGYSSTYQQVSIAAGIQSATLRLWLYQTSSETTGYDAQYVLVLDQADNLLATLLWTRSNSAQWTLQQFDLTAYAGQTIRISLGTYNDGTDGVTAMYTDDVSLEVCDAGGATATPLPTATNTPPTPGQTQPAPTATPTQPNPTPTTAPGSSTSLIDNGSFEFNGSWVIPITMYPAGYATDRAHSGSRSLRTGILSASANRFSYSDAYQVVTIPSNTTATLSMWVFLSSSEAANLPMSPEPAIGTKWGEQPMVGDRQYVLVLDKFGNLLEFLYSKRINTQIWKEIRFDVSKYAGQTIRLQFGTYNDGVNGFTSMYVDDVALDAYTISVTPTPVPQVTSTPVPGSCYEGFSNTSFETDTAWVIPITAFSAGYSDVQAHSGSRSMRTGIVFDTHNRFSYSDFRQTVSIPTGASSVTASFWLYPVSGEPTSLPVPEKPADQVFGTTAPAKDVQYVLVLDRFGNWIDTLVWQRSNSQTWTQVQFDLVKYAGMTIKLQFGTYNDGAGGVTAMYVDDVTMEICP